MRGLQSIYTGQSLVEGIEVAGAIRCGHLGICTRQELDQVGLSERARLMRAAFDALAAQLRSAA